MELIELHAEPRVVFGKRTRYLRRAGQVPANIYGPAMESVPVQVEEKALRRMLHSAGQHHLVQLTVGTEAIPRQVLVRHVQRNSVTDQILHMDLHQVPLDKLFTTQVSLVLTGESVAAVGGNIILQVLEYVTIESLPQNLPAMLEVDLGALRTVDDVIRVQDLMAPPDVKILTDGEEMVVKIERPRLVTEDEAEAEAVQVGVPVAEEDQEDQD
ncbi:MAG: 50S ribosomal protein L25 [Chloroflexi bacterium]|nr:50S ribosomal protein L25 [Chloroflexota bacterium]MBU1879131.1 50S ribosomal protein L25 [Chloroflexota bacterium]